MIDRYVYPEMGRIWAEENEFRIMLDIELIACEALAELGEVPKAAVAAIREKARLDWKRIQEVQKNVRHDVMAFLTVIAEQVGEEAKYIHLGLTASDVKETALGVRMKQTADIILTDLRHLRDVLRRRAQEHKYTAMMGRTHGMHAEPLTLGLKLAVWLDETERHIARMEKVRETVSVGKAAGAVGTYANISPHVEAYVCKKLGLSAAKVATQIVQRDRHAEFLNVLAVIASSLEKFAIEIRNLQRTDIGEVEEFFTADSQSASIMPHRRQPLISENVAGLARVVRGYALAGMENVALWHERDMTHVSAERLILPESAILTNYCLRQFALVLEKLIVYPDVMRSNMDKTGGMIFSQRVMNALVERGVMRDDAYQWVQRHALAKWQEDIDFKAGVLRDSNIMKYLTAEEVDFCFDYGYFLRHIDRIMARFGL